MFSIIRSTALVSILSTALSKQTIWGCGLLGTVPGISQNGATTPDTQKLIDGLKKSSTTGKVTYWNWALVPQQGQNLSKDFEFVPEQWGMAAVNPGLVIPSGSSNYPIGEGVTSPSTMSSLFLGSNEPDITGSCLGNLMGKCNASCTNDEVLGHRCPVALLYGPPADVLPNGHCDCWSQSEATSSGFWSFDGCSKLQPLPSLFSNPKCVDAVMSAWRQQAATVVQKGFKYLSTPLVAANMEWLSSFVDAACANCNSISCGCPSHLSWHFYGNDCRPKELGGYDNFQKKLNQTKQLMERYPHLQGAIVNEVGMLNCVMTEADQPCHPNSHNQRYPALNQTGHRCPNTPELPNGLGSFISTLIDMVIPMKTSDGRSVVAGFSWFNENMSGGTYNLELFTNGVLNEVGKSYVEACEKWANSM
eukprot:TRINITY_DN933_c0_g1_i1.p1 TRINITY_DN933_c0_g1~~TRINITY_DN933_c0_g1_i1.p1  ORF type:complete len:433 (+),score=107.38 TRINITY_DN933_c0_g1_i1:44-1300(+)